MRVEERWLGYERQSAHTGMIVRLCMGMCISNTAGVNNEHSFKSSRLACVSACARSAQLVGHRIRTEIQYLRVYSTGIQSVILLLPRKSQ